MKPSFNQQFNNPSFLRGESPNQTWGSLQNSSKLCSLVVLQDYVRNQPNELSVWSFRITSGKKKIANLHSAIPWIHKTTFPWQTVIVFSQATLLTTHIYNAHWNLQACPKVDAPHYFSHQHWGWSSKYQKYVGTAVRTNAIQIRKELLKSLLAMWIRTETYCLKFRGN